MIVEALGRNWSWPDADEKCRKVVFEWSKDLAVVYRHCANFRVAIQAGGNMGVWPWLLAKKFQQVFTCEPDPECWPHLQENIKGLKNVTALQLALLDRITVCEIHNDNPNNLGAQYVVADKGKLAATTIDGRFGDKGPVDLIYLDIEGAELPALYGAVETIGKHKPTIVVEDKGLSSRFGTNKGDIEKWLARDFGYKVVARPHRDVVMVCK